ncbi:hypothetical protein [Ruania alba]|uniref:TfoX N-terminal domain-containing protein n=1 Tax=Ruania alba TaxID=648782 RepID=A0A1H5MZ88_9MICO|nr:hypothetical protein [Ruania alba]SEE94645.1 hypothetical protein SAMN04488554_3781 [Ruania alba]
MSRDEEQQPGAPLRGPARFAGAGLDDFDDLADHFAPELRRGVMMGRPMLALEGRMLACLDSGMLGVRLGRESSAFAEAMELPGATLFAPGKGPKQFRDWAAIPAEHSSEWAYFVAAAIEARR